MNGQKKVVAILGSYRSGRTIDSVVEEILAAATECGAEATRVYLRDCTIEFCTNCRACTQQTGIHRGACPHADDMDDILEEIERADALVLASPVNFGTVTAVMKKFLERLVCYAFWPWGAAGPKERNVSKSRRAVIVVSSAAPSLMTRLLTGTTRMLKKAAGLLGAQTVGTLVIGLTALGEQQELSARVRKKARSLGRSLVL